MTLVEAIRVALSSILAHKLRSFLTLLGVIIGVAVVVAVATVIEGANAYVAEKIANLGSDVFLIEKASIQNLGDFEKYLNALRKNPDLTLDDENALRANLKLAQEVGASAASSAIVKYGNQVSEGVSLMGYTPNMINMSSTQIDSGRFITEFDDDNNRMVCFIGSQVAKEVLPGIDPIGKQIKVNNLLFQVIGVAREQGSVLGQSQDNFVIIPLSTFLKMFGSRRSIAIRIKAGDGIPIEDAQDEARMIMRARHHLDYHLEDDFSIVSSDTTRQLFGQIIGAVAAVALPITAISLIVGGIVIMNIMLVSVTERTKEIGIRKSMGARHRDILLQFLIESVTLSGLGGIIGLLFAYFTMKIVAQLTPVPAALPLWAAALAIIVSSSVGLFFGIYPANKAARLDPVEALRAE